MVIWNSSVRIANLERVAVRVLVCCMLRCATHVVTLEWWGADTARSRCSS